MGKSDNERGGEPIPSWLPRGLEHVALRLGRADDLELQLGRVAFGWSSGCGGPLTVEQVHGETPGTVDAVVTGIRPIPPSAGMLFSEAVNHLRAVLDNVVFHLVTSARGEPLRDDAARKVALPIYETAAQLASWQQRLRNWVPELCAGSALGDRIEALQPYNSTYGIPSMPPIMAYLSGAELESPHPLLLLQGYSNEDKHRAIRLAYMRTLIQRSDESFVAADHNMRQVAVGDVIATTTVGQPVLLESQAALHVERPITGTWVAPGRELHQIHAYVIEIAIPTLITGAPNAHPPLPWSVDLSDNGEDHTTRISHGGDVAAHLRAGAEVLDYIDNDETPVPILKMPPPNS